MKVRNNCFVFVYNDAITTWLCPLQFSVLSA